MNTSYWHQRAATWVSASVLVGGMVSSVILFMLVRFEHKLEAEAGTTDYLEESLSTPSRAFPQE